MEIKWPPEIVMVVSANLSKVFIRGVYINKIEVSSTKVTDRN
jgi:hypothetical protein